MVHFSQGSCEGIHVYPEELRGLHLSSDGQETIWAKKGRHFRGRGKEDWQTCQGMIYGGSPLTDWKYISLLSEEIKEGEESLNLSLQGIARPLVNVESGLIIV